jgi:hypothetical protein
MSNRAPWKLNLDGPSRYLLLYSSLDFIGPAFVDKLIGDFSTIEAVQYARHGAVEVLKVRETCTAKQYVVGNEVSVIELVDNQGLTSAKLKIEEAKVNRRGEYLRKDGSVVAHFDKAVMERSGRTAKASEIMGFGDRRTMFKGMQMQDA